MRASSVDWMGTSHKPSRFTQLNRVWYLVVTHYDGIWQIKPLTEEEKKQKLADLREKMAVKRAAKAKEDAKETLANEHIRRKAGKVRDSHSFLLSYSLRIGSLQPVSPPCGYAVGHEQDPGGDETERASQRGGGQTSRYVSLHARSMPHSNERDVGNVQKRSRTRRRAPQ